MAENNDETNKKITKQPISRRRFFSKAGAVSLGAAAVGSRLLDPTTAWARESRHSGPGIHLAASEKPNANSINPVYPPHDLPQAGDQVHEFDIDLRISVHEIVPKVKIHAFTYNGTYPGPEIRVSEGEWVQVNFKNTTSEFHTIHWHGIMLANEMDGVPMGTQWPVGPGQTFKYLFRAQPAGTHFYHCHNMTPLHVQSGMFGALIIEPKNDPVRAAFPYSREYTMALSEIDTDYVETMMNEMLEMSNAMETLSRSAKTMREMSGRMMGWFYNKKSFLDAIKNGFIPPYSKSMTGAVRQPQFNFFMINGKSYPMTEELLIKSGENIRIRFIGAGAMPHYMHIHGHDFWHVCQDGSPLAVPVRMNTIPIFPGTTSDIIVSGNNPGHWHFHDHSDMATTNNGQFPGGMMTMLMYEDAEKAGVKVKDFVQVSS